jgi:protein-L-isoaspartate(D-aspartate) O-methyltransferase
MNRYKRHALLQIAAIIAAVASVYGLAQDKRSPEVPVPDPYAAAREAMVREQIERRGIREARLLSSLRRTPRHAFVPGDYLALAYRDTPLPIGYGQTISQPYIVALMSEMLRVEPNHTVLEIGTGCGYQAAVLAPLASHVYTIEIVPELARAAAGRLASLGYRNVTVKEGDGYRGWPEKAPFDRIILTAAPRELPRALVDQLKPGGRLVAPVGEMYQELVLVEKDRNGKLTRSRGEPVRFVPMVPGKD